MYLDSRMDGRTALRIRFCLAQYFAGHRSHIALATEYIVDQVEERIPLCPIEIRVRYFLLVVPQMEQERGNGIGYGGTFSSKNAVTPYADSMDIQVGREFTGVANVDL